MILLKVVVGFLLIAESLQDGYGHNEEHMRNNEFETMKLADHFDNREFYKHKKDHFDKKYDHYNDNYKAHKKQKYYKDEKQSRPGSDKHYEKDKPWEHKKYSKYEENDKPWEHKKYSKYEENDNRPAHYMKINEIDSNDFKKSKYDGYDKHYKHPNHFEGPAKNPSSYHHDKSESYFEKHDYDKKHNKKNYIYQQADQGDQKYLDLSDDTKVNYVHSHSQDIDPDSEIVNVQRVNKPYKNKEYIQQNFQTLEEPYIKRVKKDFYQDLKVVNFTKPPSKENSALVARYIIHVTDWAALATTSSRNPLKNAPFANIISISDGPKNKGIGVPFFYLTPKDLSTQDLNKDNRCSITVTLAETHYCEKEGLDPQDPRCARLVLSGKMKRVKSGTAEEDFAKTALFSRHPVMKTWPADHDWVITKLKIGQIILLNHFGGATYIDVQEYLNIENPK